MNRPLYQDCIYAQHKFEFSGDLPIKIGTAAFSVVRITLLLFLTTVAYDTAVRTWHSQYVKLVGFVR